MKEYLPSPFNVVKDFKNQKLKSLIYKSIETLHSVIEAHLAAVTAAILLQFLIFNTFIKKTTA